MLCVMLPKYLYETVSGFSHLLYVVIILVVIVDAEV